MAIKFLDVFDETSSKDFGIRRRHVEDALRQPDQKQLVEIDDLKVLFFTKQISLPSGDFLLFVQAQEKDGDIHVYYAYKIFADLDDENIYHLAPLDVLERFINRFGIEFNIGEVQSKFILDQTIPVLQNRMTDIVQFGPGTEAKLILSWIKIILVDGSHNAQCALVYVLNQTLYESWLKSK